MGTGDSGRQGRDATKGSPASVTAELRQRIESRYQGDDAWYLLNRFLPLVEHFGRLESHNGGRYHRFQWALILTSPLTAFLVGAEALTTGGWATFLKGAALLAALVVTALAAALHAFNYLTKSVQYRSVKESLVAEFIAMDRAIGGYAGMSPEQRMARFEAASESIVRAINTEWATLQTPPQSGGESG